MDVFSDLDFRDRFIGIVVPLMLVGLATRARCMQSPFLLSVAHRAQTNSTYSNYREKQDLREALVREQRGLCCYSRCRIVPVDLEMKVKVHTVDHARPVGTIQSAWETAKRGARSAAVRNVPEAPWRIASPKATAATGARRGWMRCEGLSTFRFHDLRHTAVSRMITAGQPLPIIAKVVGWRLSTVVDMAERYGHFEQDALRRAVQAIAAPPSEVPCEPPLHPTASSS